MILYVMWSLETVIFYPFQMSRILLMLNLFLPVGIFEDLWLRQKSGREGYVFWMNVVVLDKEIFHLGLYKKKNSDKTSDGQRTILLI